MTRAPGEPAHRISVRPDFEDESVFDVPEFDVPPDAPARTKDGSPWLRWGRYGDYRGWYSIGSRLPNLSGRPTFWQATFSVACEVSGGNLDQVHCCGRGVLSIGGMGVTLRSGYGQLLLHQCLLENPERFVEVMAPVMHHSGVFTKECPESPSGVALFDHRGNPLLDEDELREAVLLGSDSRKWSEPQKARAHVWVERVSQLLRDERMDRAQEAFAQEVMPALLTEPTKEQMRWPKKGMGDAWQYSHEQRLLWALALVLALEDEEQTDELIGESVTMVPWDASVALATMQERIAQPGYTSVFQTRFLSALPKLASLFNVKLEALGE